MADPLNPNPAPEAAPENSPDVNNVPRTLDTSMAPTPEKVNLDDLPARVAERAPETLPQQSLSLAKFILFVVAALFFVTTLLMLVNAWTRG
ncbi:MAG TPA: hypothetical protein VEK08_04420 [Planctomycetota bacterium]|nr:hypothetical protein [Planctomycetota bacterium]